MPIFLNKRKKKRGNPAHRKQPTMPINDPDLVTATATKFNTGMVLPELPTGKHINSNQRNADSKMRRNGSRKPIIRLPKTISAIISNACGRRRAEQDTCTNTTGEPKENMGRLLQVLESKLRESYLIDEIQVAETPEVNGESFKKWSLSKILRKRTGFGIRTESSGLKSLGRINGDKLMRKGDAKWIGTEDVEEGELELCKKRILMGEKCRPLNLSGVLHYDKDGIFIPEDVSPN